MTEAPVIIRLGAESSMIHRFSESAMADIVISSGGWVLKDKITGAIGRLARPEELVAAYCVDALPADQESPCLPVTPATTVGISPRKALGSLPGTRVSTKTKRSQRSTHSAVA